MGYYIVRPKETLVERVLASVPANMAPENRQRRIAEVTRLRAEDSAYQEIHRWIADTQGSKAKVNGGKSIPGTAGALAVAGAESETTRHTSTTVTTESVSSARPRRARTAPQTKSRSSPDRDQAFEAVLTGTIIVDMSDEEAERMRRDLPKCESGAGAR